MDSVELQIWSKVEGLREWEKLFPVWLSYWTNEPFGSALADRWNGINLDNLKHFLHVVVSAVQVPIVVAWDRVREKAVGFIISRIVYSNELVKKLPELSPEYLANFESYSFDEDVKDKIKVIGEVVEKLCSAITPEFTNGIEKCWMLEYGCVLPEYQSQGLLPKMLKIEEKMADDGGFQFLAAVATSSYSTAALNRIGFEFLLEQSIKDVLPFYSEAPEKVQRNHPTVSVMVKRLHGRQAKL